MKITSSFFCIVLMRVILLMNITSSCMEKKNNSIGPIDLLMLSTAIEKENVFVFEKKINSHTFKIKKKKSPIEYNPFTIRHHCNATDGSTLSDEVFRMINVTAILKKDHTSSNFLNQKPNSIDECSTWHGELNSPIVEVVTEFYHKKTLLKAFHSLDIYKDAYKQHKFQQFGIFTLETETKKSSTKK